jgi:hypothetical protein
MGDAAEQLDEPEKVRAGSEPRPLQVIDSAAHALDSVRTSSHKPAAHRQEPAAHELFRQVGHDATVLGLPGVARDADGGADW